MAELEAPSGAAPQGEQFQEANYRKWCVDLKYGHRDFANNTRFRVMQSTECFTKLFAIIWKVNTVLIS